MLAALAGSGAAAYGATSEKPRVQVALSKDAYWYAPDSTMTLRVTLDNKSPQSIKGASIRVRVYSKNSTRSDLDACLEGKIKKSYLFTTTYERDTTLKPGPSTFKVQMDISTHDLADGVYPMAVEVVKGGDTLTSAITELVVMSAGEHAAVTKPLKLAVVFDILEPPHTDPSGQLADNGLARESRPSADNPGWFPELQGTVEKWRDLHLSYSLSPFLLEEIASSSAGYTVKGRVKTEKYPATSPEATNIGKVLDNFRLMAQQARFQFLPTPYASPDLEGLWQLGWRSDLQTQISRGRKTLEKYLDNTVAGEFFLPPGLNMNSRLIAGLKGQVGKFLLLGPQLLQRSREGRRLAAGSTLTSPVEVKGQKGRETVGFFADARLQSLITKLAPSQDPHGVTQFVVSELANLYLEKPSRDRLCAFVWPGSWRPTPAVLDEIMRALSQAPWIRTVTLGEGMLSVPALENITLDIPEASAEAPDDYSTQLGSARQLLYGYMKTVFVGNPNVPLLVRDIYIAESDVWRQWNQTDSGERYAASVQAGVRGEFAKISIPPTGAITLTSNRAKIPVTAVNGTGYPIKARLTCSSNGLSFPGGASKAVTLAPKENVFEVNVKVNKKGRVHFSAVLEAGGVNLGKVDVSVRTGRFSTFAIIVVGTLLGIILMVWGLRLIRRRKVGKHKRGQLKAAEEEGEAGA
jgi:hypothetical protein